MTDQASAGPTLDPEPLSPYACSSLPDGHARCAVCRRLRPAPDARLRARLLRAIVRRTRSVVLSRWLKERDRDARGLVVEKRQRLVRDTSYGSLPVAGFVARTVRYLRQQRTLADVRHVCAALDLATAGTRPLLIRRILRHVLEAERWLPSLALVSSCSVRALASAYPVFAQRSEAAYRADFEQEASEVWPARVYRQYPIGRGIALRIDFHIGTPGGDGIGVEFKTPRSGAEIQRAKGQLDQYRAAYPAGRLILVVVESGLVSEASLSLFEREVAARGIHVVRRRPV